MSNSRKHDSGAAEGARRATLDDLADAPLKDLLSTEANPLLGFRTAFGMENVGGFPEFLQEQEDMTGRISCLPAGVF